MLKRAITYTIACVLLISCDSKPDTCKDDSKIRLRIGFYVINHSNPNVIRDTIIQKLNVIGFNQTDSLYSNSKTAKIALPLSKTSESCTFSIALNGIETMLQVKYKTNLIFDNYKCGFYPNFILEDVSFNKEPLICDSIQIIQSNITDVNQENCKCYIHY